MSNEQTPWGRKDIPVGTKVITSGFLKRQWAHRIMVVEKQPAGARGVNYTLKDPRTTDRVLVRADAVRVYTGDKESGYDDPSVTHEGGVTSVKFVPSLKTGVVASVHGVPGVADGTLVVSLGPSKRMNETKAARLGGDERDRYWPGLPTESLTVVEDALSIVTAALAAKA